MFSLCPHCQFLLARDPRSGRLPAACPKCGGEVVDDHPPPPPEAATGTDAPPDQDESAAGDVAPPSHHARRPRRRRAAEDAGKDAPAPPETAEAADATPQAAAARPGDADAGTPVDAVAEAESPTKANAEASPEADSSRDPVPGPDPQQVPERGPDPAEAAAAGPAADRSAQARTVASQGSDPDDAPAPSPAPAAAAAAAAESLAASGDSEDPADAPPAPAVSGTGPSAAPPPRPAPQRASRPSAPRGRRLPSFLQPRGPGAQAPRRETTILWSAIGLLALVLFMQLLLADRARLAMDAGWRPTLVRMCGVFGCTLPPWREPQAFTMLSRDVRAHPQRPGTLRVTASFRNDARWPQSWPVLLLSLSDLDGRVAGARAFAKEDYVEADDRDRLLEPGQVATVTLDVVEPSPHIVAFTFDFR
jgi:hypothetical protein